VEEGLMDGMDGTFLRRLRLRDSISQREIAKRANVDIKFLREYEHESRAISDEEIHLYCNALGITFDGAMEYFSYLQSREGGLSASTDFPYLTSGSSTEQRPQARLEQALSSAPSVRAVITPPDQAPMGKLTFNVGKSFQISTEEWERVDVGIELPFPVEGDAPYEEVMERAIYLTRLTLQREVRKVIFAAADAVGVDVRRKDGVEDGGITSVSQSTGATAEKTSGDSSASLGTTAHRAPREWDIPARP